MKRIKWDKIAILVMFVILVSIIVNKNNDVIPTKTIHVWTKLDSKAYAKDSVNDWAHKQYVCLASLWGKESAWKHTALNPEKVMGKNAGGIPQLLGLSPTTPPTIQIDRGLDYIFHRYVTPCKAWDFHKKNGWY
jgi:hypothetical protein